MPSEKFQLSKESSIIILRRFSKDSESKDFSTGITLIFSKFTSENSKAVIGIALSLIVVSYVGISKLTVENRFIDYFKPSTEIYKGMELLDKKLGGTAPLDIVLNAPSDWALEEEGFDDDFGFEEDIESSFAHDAPPAKPNVVLNATTFDLDATGAVTIDGKIFILEEDNRLKEIEVTILRRQGNEVIVSGAPNLSLIHI